MKPPKQKIVIIYHGGCRDGFGGAWAVWKKFGNKAAYLPAFDRFALPCPLKNKEVYLIDYTYKPDLVKKLLKDNIRVTAIDHHISSKDAARLTQAYSFDLFHSGAVLAWKYFHPKEKVPMLLRYIEDEDLWKFKIPHSKEVLLFLELFAQDFAVWSKIAKALKSSKKRNLYAKNGTLILRYQRSLLEHILPNAELVRFAGYTVYAVNAPGHFASDLGKILAQKTHSFALVWNEGKGKIKVSLRSDGSVDVSKIAQKFNGGGHKSASGFYFDVGKKFPWKLVPGAKRK